MIRNPTRSTCRGRIIGYSEGTRMRRTALRRIRLSRLRIARFGFLDQKKKLS